MKAILQKAVGIVLICWLPLLICGQTPTIEIHQIDIGTGDATLIKINSTTGLKTILIDAGSKDLASTVIAYLQKELGLTQYIDYVIASHYHEDHIGGLVGTKKKSHTNCFVNLGVLDDSTPVHVFAVLDKGSAPPVPTTKVYKDYVTLSGNRRVLTGSIYSGRNVITPPPHAIPPPLPDSNQRLALGGYINLGMDSNNVPIRLRCVAADARVYKPGGTPQYIDVADSNGVSRITPPKGMENANNWGLAWVLEYGKFRYFTGGDIGGKNTRNYLDIETPLSSTLPLIYNNTTTFKGHICAFKINHHGSEHSSNRAFLDTLKSTFISISSGFRHEHPTESALGRIQNSRWDKRDSLKYIKTQLFCMTNLKYIRNIDTSVGATSGNVKYVVTNTPPKPHLIDSSIIINPPGSPFASPIYLYTVKKDSAGNVNGNIVITVFPTDGNGHRIDQLSVFSVKYRNYNGVAGDPWIQRPPYICHE